MKYSIGIDCGLSGGIVVLNDTCKIELKLVTPVIKGPKNEYNVSEMIKLLKPYTSDAIIGIEKQQAFKQQGVTSTFKTGRGYGLWEGIVAALGASYILVHAKTWQKEILKDVNKLDTKQASALIAHRVFPNESFKATARCTTDHDGLTDACCISLYVYRINKLGR